MLAPVGSRYRRLMHVDEPRLSYLYFSTLLVDRLAETGASTRPI